MNVFLRASLRGQQLLAREGFGEASMSGALFRVVLLSKATCVERWGGWPLDSEAPLILGVLH